MYKRECVSRREKANLINYRDILTTLLLIALGFMCLQTAARLVLMLCSFFYGCIPLILIGVVVFYGCKATKWL